MNTDFDLHIHTKLSDGEFTVKELISLLQQTKIKKFAITDHDSIDSVNELKNLDLGDLEYINGTEISSILDGKYKMHILGYNFDETNPKLKAITKKLKEARMKRFTEIVDAVSEKYDIQFDPKDIEDILANENIPSKPHLGKLMMKLNIVESVREAFDKYLEDISVKTKNREDAKIVIEAIKEAGGTVIWAHPKKVEKEYNIDFTEILPRMIELGLDGIEVYNSLHTLNDCQRYKEIAQNYKLKTSGGSDYHGVTIKPHVKLGMLYNSDENYTPNIQEITIID